MSVQRLRDEEQDDLAQRSSRVGSRAPSRPQSALRPPGGTGSMPTSRRGSLHELVRPADEEKEIIDAQPDGEYEAAGRSIASSPIPGAVGGSATNSTSSKRRAAARQPEHSTGPRYTTTLEEDEARDAAEAAARQQRQREADALEAMHGDSGISIQPVPGRQSSQHRRKQSTDLPPRSRRASFAEPISEAAAVSEAEPLVQEDQPSSDADLIQPVHVRRASQSIGPELGGRQRRKYHPEEVDGGARPSPSPQPHEESSGGEEEESMDKEHSSKKMLQQQQASDEIPPADEAQQQRDPSRPASRSQQQQSAASRPKSQQSQQRRSRPVSAHGEEEPVEEQQPVADDLRSVSKSKSKSKSRAKSRPVSAHGEEEPAVVEEEPQPAAEEPEQQPALVEEEEEEPPLPVFERPARKYHIIEDPSAELERIRANKDFEEEFDDITLPTFLSAPPGEESLRAVRENPLKLRYEEVHSLIDLEQAAPLPSVEDSELLNDILGVGKLSLEEAGELESELETDRLEEIQKELQRSARRELELATLQHALLQAFTQTEDLQKKELLEKEHQLLQSSRLLMKEEQESFRRAEDKMRAWLEQKKQAVLNTHMQDLFLDDAAMQAQKEKERIEKENQAQEEKQQKGLKERGTKEAAEKEKKEKEQQSTSEEEKLEQSRMEIQDLYARVRSRKYEIKWNYEPRLIRIRLDWLRCLKNKLPLGQYNIMITLYDRLGGDALRWSTANVGDAMMNGNGSDGNITKGSTCFSHTGSTTLPQRHSGKFYNLELSFNQRANRIFLACPSMLLSRPSMVFIFELFLMGDASIKSTHQSGGAGGKSQNQGKRGSILDMASGVAGKGVAYAQEMLLKARDPKQYALLKAAQANAARQALQRAPPSSDRVVAWGAFPMAYINFDIIRGQFKVPLLRGAYGDEPIEKFQTIHEKIAGNLDNWLANLYFDVRHWPRLLDHAVENSVELNFKGKKVDGDDEESSDEEEEDEIYEQITEDGVLIDKSSAQTAAQRLLAENDGSGIDFGALESDILILDDGSSGHLAGSAHQRFPSGSAAPQNSQRAHEQHHAIDLGGGVLDSRKGQGKQAISGASSLTGSKKKKKKPTAAKPHGAKHEAVTSTERRMKIKLHTRKYPGMLLDLPDMDAQTVSDLRNQKKRAEMCAKYRYNVNLASESGLEGEEGTASQANNPLGRRAAYKMRYIANEIWNDLGVKRLRDWEFFFFLIFVSLWVRIYTHYLGQYLFLSSIYVPITEYDCKWYTCDISYVWDPLSVTAQTQIGVVVIGVLTNMIILGIMIGIVSIIQRVLGRTPSWASRMLLGWGCGTIFEPFLILIIDLCRHHWYGDSFKLYQYYLSKDGNGVAGIFMTILLTMMLVTCSVVEFYFYIIKIHMNGRILDVHYRLHGDASLFHIPHDLEISVRELRWILIKARRWVGMGGQKRKIQVSKFRVRDPLRPVDQQDVSIYIAIYTQSLNGDIELFRHFLRNPSGSIVEIFDSFDIPGEEAFKRIEDKFRASEKRVLAVASMLAGSKTNPFTGSLRLGSSLGSKSPPGPATPKLGPSIGGNRSVGKLKELFTRGKLK